MPIYLPPINRRRFLGGALASGAGLLLPQCLAAAERPVDPDCYVLFADTHVPQEREQVQRGIKPAEMCRQAVTSILALDSTPAAAIIAGDCAFLQGKRGDYATLRQLLRPLRLAGVPLHLALGNHDHRENFWATFSKTESQTKDRPLPPDKHVAVVETPQANWFLLDSLNTTNVAPGLFGEAQLAWLAKAIDARPNKPALVLGHHNPDPVHGLTDAAAFFDVVVPRKQVKAYFFGHTHRWNCAEYLGLHLVNIPAVAWQFTAAEPRGFVTTQLNPHGATIVLHTLDQKHPKHGQKIELKWRVIATDTTRSFVMHRGYTRRSTE
jgi:3',5'-cyclic-AMP phosphodiesterase